MATVFCLTLSLAENWPHLSLGGSTDGWKNFSKIFCRKYGDLDSATSTVSSDWWSENLVSLPHPPPPPPPSLLLEKKAAKNCRRFRPSDGGTESRQSALGFFFPPNWDPPTPSSAGECAPSPFGSGGRAHSLAGEGGGGVPIPTSGHAVQHKVNK
jgi:hypothetical protein